MQAAGGKQKIYARHPLSLRTWSFVLILELKKRFRGVRIERREDQREKLQCRYPAETYPVVYKTMGQST